MERKPDAIPVKNVIAWHDFQPEDTPQGASPLDALQLQYETRYDLMRLFQKVVRNGGSGDTEFVGRLGKALVPRGCFESL